MKTLKLNVTTPPIAAYTKTTLAARSTAWLQSHIARLVLSVGLGLVAPWALAAPPVVLSIAAGHSPVAGGETLSLTVTYDAAMDTTINPVVSFPTAGEDASAFMTATTSAWQNNTTFTQNYTAQSTPPSLTNVDVAVNGAQDTLGVAQQAGFQANVFEFLYIPAPSVIDMKGQIQGEVEVISPTGVGRAISAADVGKTVDFIIRYDIPTDYDDCGANTIHNNLCTNITFTNTGGTPLSLTNVVSVWQTRNRYKVTWTIADGDEQFDSINVVIAGGVGRRDDTSIKNTDKALTAVFSIDTKHPTVTGVTTGSTAITSTTPASGLVTLTVTYSHAMDTTSTPSLSFPNQALGAVLTPTTGAWTDSTHYAQTYQVSGVGVTFASVDVKVSGARKATSGNLQREGTVAGVFGINLSAATPTLASLVPLIVNIPGVGVIHGSVLDANCCGDIFVRVLSKALNTPLTLVGQTATGTMVLDGYQGGRLAFLVTAVATADARDEGVYAVGDGQYQVVSGGVAATIVPALVDIGQLAGLLPQGSTIHMTASGVLTATIDGITYVVQPGVAVQRLANTDGKPGLTKGNDGKLRFMDTAGNSQTLHPAFLEPQTLRNYLRTIDSSATLAIQLDGTAKLVLQGKTYDLVPDSTLSGLPSNVPGHGWLQDAAQHYLFLNQQRANTAQGLGLNTR